MTLVKSQAYAQEEEKDLTPHLRLPGNSDNVITSLMHLTVFLAIPGAIQ